MIAYTVGTSPARETVVFISTSTQYGQTLIAHEIHFNQRDIHCQEGIECIEYLENCNPQS
jgi:hypothetical protein